jgi:hypothetical protein
MVAAIAGRGGGDAEAEVLGGAPGDVTFRRDATSLLRQIQCSSEYALHLKVLGRVIAALFGWQGHRRAAIRGSWVSL